MSAEAKKMGAKLKFEKVKTNCRATSDLAYYLLEYDFVATMEDGAWKWAHWHSSLSAVRALNDRGCG